MKQETYMESIRRQIYECAVDGNKSSFEDIWKYLVQVFDFSKPDECIRKSENLYNQIIKNHGIVPDIGKSGISDVEKFEYIGVVGQVVKIALRYHG